MSGQPDEQETVDVGAGAQQEPSAEKFFPDPNGVKVLAHELRTAQQMLRAAWRRERALAVRGERLEKINLALRGELARLAREARVARDAACHDDLTGLPNRRSLRERVEPLIELERRNRSGLAVLLIDLDDFKGVNDRVGHCSGDQVLKIAASRLAAEARESDAVCRYGGDEFIVVLAGCPSPLEVGAIERKLLLSLERPYHVEDYEIHMAASIGCALLPADGTTLDSLIRAADEALFRRKVSRRRACIIGPTVPHRGAQVRGLESPSGGYLPSR